MPQVQWTKAQSDAIEARGGALLVSAAAGSGKTAVLTERVVRLICDGSDPMPADRLLIVTFSNAAAAEMKERIAAKLEDRIECDPENDFLRSQQALLQNAMIGTIHAFCLSLLRTNFQLLDLPADLRVADERELELLRRDILSELIAARYEEADPLFHQTVELFSAARNDERLFTAVLRLYDFTRSHPFPEQWMQKKLSLYDSDIPIGETIWGNEILQWAGEAISFALASLNGAVEILLEDERLTTAYLPAYRSDIEQLDRLQELLLAVDWDGAVNALKRFDFQKLKALRGYEDEEKKQAVSDARRSVKDLIERLRARVLCASSNEAREDIIDLRPKIELLFSMADDFARRFSQVKAERRVVDFSDLEQFATRLLCSVTEEGVRAPTPLAQELQDSYDCILIDEYQDTNEAQELIFSCIQNGRNLFMVGDVKQSIYGFRQASPQIFMEKKDAYPYYHTGVEQPSKIILGANFRSHPFICGAVNFLFGSLMSRRVGQVEYGEDERLLPLGVFSENPDAGVFLEIVDATGSDTTATELEAEHVAARIDALLRERRTVTDRGTLRPVRPGDIAILLRSPRSKAEHYLKALARHGVPGFSGTQSTFLRTLEISTIFSILKAVNNPLQDIPLVSAMMSPVWAFSADDVARIRLYKKGGPFYLALLEGRRQGDVESSRFLDALGGFRRLAAFNAPARLISSIYEATALPSLVHALDHAEARSANLDLFIEYAHVYERAGWRTLPQFLRLIEGIEDAGNDLAPANPSGTGRDAVQIMSIHRSKGLEFPVVFVSDCAKRFNRDDLRQNVMLHARLGFACVRRNYETMSQFSTVPLEAARLAGERELMSEELRVLYVALTRAKELLILTGTLDHAARKLAALRVPAEEDSRLPPYAVASAGSPLDWLAMAVLPTVNGAPLREYAGLPAAGCLCAESAIHCRVVPAPEVGEGSGEAAEQSFYIAQPTAALRESLSRVLSRTYPYEAAQRIPTKIAVTELAREPEVADSGLRFSKKPQFITHEKLTAAMRGDAFHKYMLFANHAHAKERLESELGRLVSAMFLTADEAASLERKELAVFYEGTLYNRLARADRVEREYRFIAQLGEGELSHLYPGLGPDTVTVQGICDLLFFEGERAILVDYKTDRVQDGAALLERYGDQLRLYAFLLARILPVPVSQCLIYSTALARELSVELRV